MQFLNILYWLILILSTLGLLAPASWPNAGRINSISAIVLFAIIGLRLFPISLQ